MALYSSASRCLARREQDLQPVVGGEGAGFLVTVDRVQLRHRLNDGQEPQVVAGEKGGRRRDRADPADRRELVVDEQALQFEIGVVRQCLGVEADQLREEEVEQRSGVGDPVRRDADVDRHPPPPHVLEPEVVGARGGVDDRVGEDRQRRIEGRDDAGQRVVRVGQQALQRVGALVREPGALPAPACHHGPEMVLERLALPGGLPEHLADGPRQVGGLEQVEPDAQEEVARLVR